LLAPLCRAYSLHGISAVRRPAWCALMLISVSISNLPECGSKRSTVPDEIEVTITQAE